MMASVNTLEFFVATLLLVAFFYWPWKEYWVEYTRQDLFELRDELFMMAARGELSFDSAGYNVLRSYFNGAIQFTHRFRLVTLAGMLLWRNRGSGSSSDGRLA